MPDFGRKTAGRSPIAEETVSPTPKRRLALQAADSVPTATDAFEDQGSIPDSAGAYAGPK